MTLATDAGARVRPRDRRLTLAAGAAAALVLICAMGIADAARAASLPPRPGICKTLEEQNCSIGGRGGRTTVAPAVVQVGQSFTVTLTSVDGEYGGVGSYDPPTFGPARPGVDTSGFRQIGKCSGRLINKGGDQFTSSMGLDHKAVCRYKALRPSKGWILASFGFSVRYGGLASQNGDSFAIIGKRTKVVLSGRILTHRCTRITDFKHTQCELEVVGLSGGRVVVAGKGGAKTVRTDARGFYSVEVARGSHTVRASASGRTQPVSRTVNAQSDVNGLDFDHCGLPANYHAHEHLGQPAVTGCELVKVSGTAVDIDGRTYSGVYVLGPGDLGLTNHVGRFGPLYFPRGQVTLTGINGTPTGVSGVSVNSPLGALGSTTVHATHTVTNARLVLRPKAETPHVLSDAGFVFNVDALPLRTTPFTLSFQRSSVVRDDICRSSRTIEFTAPERLAQFEVAPSGGNGKFCAGNYTLTVDDGTRILISMRKTIPVG